MTGLQRAGLMWLSVLVAIAIFEGWAVAHAEPTLSQWVWWFAPAHPWFSFAVVGSMAFLMYHFFWQRRR